MHLFCQQTYTHGNRKVTIVKKIVWPRKIVFRDGPPVWQEFEKTFKKFYFNHRKRIKSYVSLTDAVLWMWLWICRVLIYCFFYRNFIKLDTDHKVVAPLYCHPSTWLTSLPGRSLGLVIKQNPHLSPCVIISNQSNLNLDIFID